MHQSITPILRARLLEELQLLRNEIFSYLQIDHSDEYGKLRIQLEHQPLSHWPELLRHWLTPELENRSRRLELVQAALSQMDMGLYGLCSDCESRIERELLMADPARQRCAHCESKHNEQIKSNKPLIEQR